MTPKEIRDAVAADPELRGLWRRMPKDHTGKNLSAAALAALRRFSTRLDPKDRTRIARALGIPVVEVIIAHDLDRGQGD